MQPVKVNIFISYAPEDRPQLDKLLRWLYPMRDEVNLWYNNPPKNPAELSLPWQLLLFWYIPPNNRSRYNRVFHAQREKAHIYLFLTSYKSLSSPFIEEDIDVAATRRIAGDDLVGPFIFPIILTPSRWKEESRLAGFKPMADGAPLSSFKVEEEGYLNVTEEISALIKVLQAKLGEAKFYQSRLVATDQGLVTSSKRALPYLGESDGDFDYQEVEAFQPPEWLGWSILLFLFISFMSSLMPARVASTTRYKNEEKPREYLREHQMVPTSDTIRFPSPD